MKKIYVQWGVYAALGLIGMAGFIAVVGESGLLAKVVGMAMILLTFRMAKMAKREGWLPDAIANVEE